MGTSIGAANATGLALWGVDQTGVAALERAYEKMAASNLMNPHLAQLTLRILSGHPRHYGSRRVAEFFIAEGINPDLRFGQVGNVRLGLVAADLASGQPVLYGQDPEESIFVFGKARQTGPIAVEISTIPSAPHFATSTELC